MQRLEGHPLRRILRQPFVTGSTFPRTLRDRVQNRALLEVGLDAAIAFGEPKTEDGVHLKSSREFGVGEVRFCSTTAKRSLTASCENIDHQLPTMVLEGTPVVEN